MNKSRKLSILIHIIIDLISLLYETPGEFLKVVVDTTKQWTIVDNIKYYNVVLLVLSKFIVIDKIERNIISLWREWYKLLTIWCIWHIGIIGSLFLSHNVLLFYYTVDTVLYYYIIMSLISVWYRHRAGDTLTECFIHSPFKCIFH